MYMNAAMEEAARTAITQCLAVEDDEDVLVVTDEQTRSIGEALVEVSRRHAGSTSLLLIEDIGENGAEPPASTAGAMASADVVLAPTAHSLTHTDARREACDADARVATLPGVTEEVFTGAMTADYEEIARKCRLLMSKLRSTETVRVTAPNGTDLSVDVRFNDWHADTGMIHEPGAFGNLPAGEISGPGLHATGTVVIDSDYFCPPGTEIEINHGSGVSISDRDCRLAEAFEDVDMARNVAELGIGTNPEATLVGNLLQDEKVMGTCHVAFGNDLSYGGSHDAEIHWDNVIEDPTIRFDDDRIMEDGDFVGLEI